MDRGFEHFEAWREEVAEQEARDRQKLARQIVREEHWLTYGVTARRKRNVRRLAELGDLRQKKREMGGGSTGLSLAAAEGVTSGKQVVVAEHASRAFDGRVIVGDLSLRILRGDRVGIIGPNGAGKTTLIKLLTGVLQPDSGTVRLGTNLQIALVDQQRTQLDPDETVWSTLTDGAGDSITVRGVQRHVMGYLRDFLFEDRQAHSPVRSLSGGERNRLLLAKLLAKSSNLLILDEPTNDLDMDTLDLLEETLADYDGTLLVVSHDRDFLDRLVTSVIFVEGDGRLEEYVGGYTDALRQRGIDSVAEAGAAKPAAAKSAPPPPRAAKATTKLSYKDQRELDELPKKLEKLTAEMAAISAKLADPAFYGRDPEGFAKQSARLTAAQAEHEAAEERWLELEMLKEQVKQA
jgi:ATP-binding cassette subfamily F protein uup